MKTTLGIDPGNEFSAYTIYRDGKLIKFGKVPNDEMKFILTTVCFKKEVDIVLVEGIQSFGMPVGKTVFETAYMVGRYLGICDVYQQKSQIVYRSDIKMHFCATTKAKDGNIRQALIDRFGEVGVKKNPGILYGVSADVWSSTAIAVYASDKDL